MDSHRRSMLHKWTTQLAIVLFLPLSGRVSKSMVLLHHLPYWPFHLPLSNWRRSRAALVATRGGHLTLKGRLSSEDASFMVSSMLALRLLRYRNVFHVVMGTLDQIAPRSEFSIWTTGASLHWCYWMIILAILQGLRRPLSLGSLPLLVAIRTIDHRSTLSRKKRSELLGSHIVGSFG